MVLRLVIDDHDTGKRYNQAQERHAAAVPNAMMAAAVDTATAIESRGRTDITDAGNFGTAWTSGFQSKPSATSDGVLVTTTMTGRGWKIFQYGRTLQGHPLLWIPLSTTDAKGTPMRRYPAQLVQVQSRSGLPLMISRTDNRPKYFGKSTVTIPKKFHLVEIATEEGNRLGERYEDYFNRMIAHG